VSDPAEDLISDLIFKKHGITPWRELTDEIRRRCKSDLDHGRLTTEAFLRSIVTARRRGVPYFTKVLAETRRIAAMHCHHQWSSLEDKQQCLLENSLILGDIEYTIRLACMDGATIKMLDEAVCAIPGNGMDSQLIFFMLVLQHEEENT
jgi:hypothetical protein